MSWYIARRLTPPKKSDNATETCFSELRQSLDELKIQLDAEVVRIKGEMMLNEDKELEHTLAESIQQEEEEIAKSKIEAEAKADLALWEKESSILKA
jgi:hypothetical protein